MLHPSQHDGSSTDFELFPTSIASQTLRLSVALERTSKPRGTYPVNTRKPVLALGIRPTRTRKPEGFESYCLFRLSFLIDTYHSLSILLKFRSIHEAQSLIIGLLNSTPKKANGHRVDLSKGYQQQRNSFRKHMVG